MWSSNRKGENTIGSKPLLKHLQTKTHRNTILLGFLVLILAQYSGTRDLQRILSIVALGPILGGLITLVRLRSYRENTTELARTVVTCGWIAFTSGLVLLVPTLLHRASFGEGIGTALAVVAVALLVLGLYVVVTIRKIGFSPWPR